MNDPLLELLDAVARRVGRVEKLIVALARVCMAATMLYWLGADSRLEALVGGAALLLTWVPERWLGDAALRPLVRAFFVVLLAAHVVLGMALGAYERAGSYDKFVHILAFAVIAVLICAAAARACERESVDPPASWIGVVALAGALGLGALWELFEFAVDSTGLFRAQRGLADTMWDLAADLAGAFVVVAFNTVASTARRVAIRA